MELFDSSIRTKGDLAGVFEYDGTGGPNNSTAYFYLYRTNDGEADGVMDTIHILSGAWAITQADIAVKWDKGEQRVGLFIFGALRAAFDTASGKKYGGDYRADFNPDIPWSNFK